MSKNPLEVSPVWCNNKIITYDFCLEAYECLSGTTSPMPTLYNGKVYYTIPTSPQTFLWWSINLNKWIFSNTVGNVSSISLEYQGDYPYDRGTKWDGDFNEGEYFNTCDCTCFTKPDYNGNQFLPINECGVITIYPMNINCIPIPPSKVGGNGSLSLQIAGGTPPYSIRLLNTTGNVIVSNSTLILIPNLQPGTYFVEITDNFGDFQQVINCTIVAPPPPPTPTPTALPPTPSYQEYSMCMRVNIKGGGGRTGPVSYIFELSFTLYSFTSVNNIISPIYISSTGDEIISWDYSLGYWSLSASTSSDFTPALGNQSSTNWELINSSSLSSNVPLGAWQLITNLPYQRNISTTIGICKQPTLFLFINESWWQYYGANIPNQYRGTSCGGNNQTPWFKWSVQNLGGLQVFSYDILCTNDGTGDIYFDVTNINFAQTEVSNTIPWISSSINPTTGGGTANSRGWEGPCLPPFSNPNFTVTLTAYLSNSTTLTASINFIYCQTVTTGICSI